METKSRWNYTIVSSPESRHAPILDGEGFTQGGRASRLHGAARGQFRDNPKKRHQSIGLDLFYLKRHSIALAPHYPKSGALTMSLPELKDPQSAKGVVDWLESLVTVLQENEQEACIHIATELMDKIFKGNELDALKPFATTVDRNKKGNPPKYPQLIITRDDRWKEANTNFRDPKGKWYIQVLVHLGGVLRNTAIVPEQPSFKHNMTLASAISKKLVRIPDATKPKNEKALYLDDFASQLLQISEDDLDKELERRLKEAKAAKQNKRDATKAANQTKSQIIQQQVISLSPVDIKELKRLEARVKDITKEIDKLSTLMKETLLDLSIEIRGTIKTVEIQKRK